MSKPRKGSRTWREAKVRAMLLEPTAIAGAQCAEHGSWSVDDAAALVDWVDPDATVDGVTRLEREREWYERTAPMTKKEDAEITDGEADRAKHFREIIAALAALMKLAIRARKVDKNIDSGRGWLFYMGVREVHSGGEVNCFCLFCDADLATVGEVRKILPPVTARMRRHCNLCAMRWLLRRRAELTA